MEDRVVCSCLDVTYNTIKEAIENNTKIINSNDENKANWIERETYVLKEIYKNISSII